MLSLNSISGPYTAVLQCRDNPWQSRSKPQTLRRFPKISSIFWLSYGERIRYQADKNRYYTLILAIGPRSDTVSFFRRVYIYFWIRLNYEKGEPANLAVFSGNYQSLMFHFVQPMYSNSSPILKNVK